MSEIIVVLGVALVIVNMQANKQTTDLIDLITNPSTANTNIPNVRSDLYLLGGEIFLVLVLAFIANFSKTAGTLILALVVGLWVVWTMKNQPSMNTFFQSLQGNVPGSKRSTKG